MGGCDSHSLTTGVEHWNTTINNSRYFLQLASLCHVSSQSVTTATDH